MSKNILFRCDASNLIGSGHVIRCRTLARQLKNINKNKVVFLCRQQKGDFIQILKEEFEVIELEKISKKDFLVSKNKNIYESWLGCSQKEDAKNCLATLKHKKYNFDWIILDHYGIDQKWQSEFLNGFSNNNKPKIMVIDDLANRSHEANIILNQNLIELKLKNPYQSLVPEYCINLLGPKYALLDSEYSKIHNNIKERVDFKNVLIYFGAVDPKNFVEKSLRKLLEANIPDLCIDVVISSYSKNYKKIKKISEENNNVKIHISLPTLVDLISKADFSIGAAGSTTWERVCLKLPTLVIATAENQINLAKSLANKRLIYLIGDWNTSQKKIKNSLNFLINKDFKFFNFDFLVDGLGAKRVANYLNNIHTNNKLRRVEDKDELLLLRWANDNSVRKNSFSESIINKKEHNYWFQKSLHNPERFHFIYEDENLVPIGQIRFDLDKNNNHILIDISIESFFRGKGLGTRLLGEGINKMKNLLKGNYIFVAEIKKQNIASKFTFAKAGFIEKSLDKSKNCVKMIYELKFGL